MKHGAYIGGGETTEHAIWRGMIARCHNPNAKDYHRYGHTGITVCERWRESYETFRTDVGPRPAGKSLDRYPNPVGNYEPGNVRWATRSEQEKNKLGTKRWREDGVVGTLGEWAILLGISKQLASIRWKSWGTFERGRVWQLQKEE